MEQIKFRFWDKMEKKMYFDFMVHSLSGKIYTVNSNSDIVEKRLHQHDIVTMQFTGLLDMNGQGIFEGDIVLLPKGYYPIREVVKYVGGGFSPFAIPSWEVTPKSKECKVIGNVYEHAALLESR
jgi:uncharacterized phage protein (TIGR01671 family)